MQITVMKNLKWLMLTIFIFALCLIVEGQEVDSKMKIDCITLRMIAQKPAPKIKEKPAPDVIVETPDDIHIRFELNNNCDQTIYFLSSLTPDEKYPAGFMIYRNKNNEWKARFPDWRREGNLTGITYTWVPLKTGKSIEFEYSDLSLIEGERSIAIYVNFSPSHEKRVELLAEPFTIKKP